MKILVTGAAGYIGSHLCERLAGLGHSVVGIDAFTDYYPVCQKRLNARDVEAKGVKIYEADLAKEDVSKICEGVEVVFHFAAQPGIADHVRFEEFVKNNITATYKLVNNFLNEKDFKMFVNISTSSVYGLNATSDETGEVKPSSYYGVTKLASEQLVLSYQRRGKLKACSLRLFSIYGPRERPDKLFPALIKAMLRDEEFPLYEGSEKHWRSFTYVGDVIDAFVKVLNQLDKVDGEIFNIGTDTCITTGEAIKIVEGILGKKAKAKVLPKRGGDQFKTHTNIGKAKKVLGYIPSTTPREGLKKTVDWYKKHINELP